MSRKTTAPATEGKGRDRIPFYSTVLAFVAGALLTGLFVRGLDGKQPEQPAPVAATAATPEAAPLCDYRLVRAQGYAGIEPVLVSERQCESVRYADLKARIGKMVDAGRADGSLTDASVYLRMFGRGEWTILNDSAHFRIGGLMEVPVMMAYMRNDEADDQVERRYPLAGKEYPVKDLIHLSIASSDDRAGAVLLGHVPMAALQRIFKDLSLPAIDGPVLDYGITARDYSMFFRTLFDASYLGIHDSELAMAELASCNYEGGLRAGIPAGVRVAHKAGRASTGDEQQLHEAAVVYLDNDAYLLTVMTKGHDEAKLSGFLRDVSKLVYGTLRAQ